MHLLTQKCHDSLVFIEPIKHLYCNMKTFCWFLNTNELSVLTTGYIYILYIKLVEVERILFYRKDFTIST